ncbi:MAG TPA: alpha/beta hydrolase [Oculatellaceae cyanobacterium]
MKRKKIAGTWLEYRMIRGSNYSKPTIVFLHEGLGSIAQWRGFPDNVCSATGCSGLVYNRAGYGNSSPAKLPRTIDFMHQEGQVVLPELLKKFNVQNAIFVGHSDGGSIALIFAANPTIPVHSMVLIAPHVFVEDITVQSISRAQEEYVRGNLKSRFAKYHPHTDHTFLSWSNSWLNPEFRKWNIQPFLPEIKIPVLVIQGEQDEFGTFKQVEAIQKECSGAVDVVLIPECGHRPHIEFPETTLACTIRFIQQSLSRNAVST